MEHFIEAVRRYPCLWDTAAPEYRDQELKDAAWADLVKETDLTSGDVSGYKLSGGKIFCTKSPSITLDKDTEYVRSTLKDQTYIFRKIKLRTFPTIKLPLNDGAITSQRETVKLYVQEETYRSNETDPKRAEEMKEVKLKWKKLRDSYRDALKRQSEVAAGGKRGSAWKYTHLMHFLQPHMNARKKPPFLPAPREPSAEAGEGERVNGHEASDDSCSTRSSTPRRRRARPAPLKRPLSPRHLELPDPLDIFFNSMCQSTKRLPYPAQIRIKKALFAAVIEAEESLLAEQQSYAALWARGAASTSGSEPAAQQDDVKPYA